MFWSSRNRSTRLRRFAMMVADAGRSVRSPPVAYVQYIVHDCSRLPGGCSRINRYLWLMATSTIANTNRRMRYFRNSESLIRPPPLVRTPIRIVPGLSGQGGQTPRVHI